MAGRVCGAIFIGVALLAGARDLRAQGDPWQRQVQQGLERSAALLRAQGYRPTGEERRSELILGESVVLHFTLSAGGSYAIVGICDDDCGGLNLVLSDPTHYEVDADRGGGTVPIMRATPARPGEYRVQVTMVVCRVSPCRYAVAVYRKAGR
ncbi:MAG: hypothetical protein ACHQXA_00185 [Gemmatimonadales bacterium]